MVTSHPGTLLPKKSSGMPSVRHLEATASARILTTADKANEEPVTLGKATGIAIRRLSWSIQLKSVEILAKDLNKEDWQEERQKFYKFAYSHILRPDTILDHFDYFQRLLSLAIGLEDFL